jgi:cytochrome c oxidase assembly protein subunit 15
MSQLPTQSEKLLRRWARVTWVSAYLVVLAGSIVRMTGSGMGCPDWPKCFGLLIPPTEASQVTWDEKEEYASGRMLVARDTLWVLTSDVAANSFEEARSEGWIVPYEKHNYAVFNPVHTWVEFINRLIGAFTGIPALLFLVLSTTHAIRYRQWRPFFTAIWTLVMLGFAAWLGKKVVDGNLIPGSITLHMVGALAILVGLMWFISDSLRRERPQSVLIKRPWVAFAALIAAGQLIFGTQVREAIDSLSQAGILRASWVDSLPVWWKAHRSASWAVLLVNAAWIVPVLRRSEGQKAKRAAWGVAAILLCQIASGILLVHAGMPALGQPVHLLLGMGLVLANVWTFFRHTH